MWPTGRSLAAAAAAGDLHLEFAVHAAAYTVAIQMADPAGAARSLGRLHAIADVIGAPQMTWTVGWFEAFVATMQARFADAGRLGRETEALGLALGAAEGVAVFAGQAAVLATIAGHHAELPPIVAQALEAGPVKLTYHLAHAIASGPKQVAIDLLVEAAAEGFRIGVAVASTVAVTHSRLLLSQGHGAAAALTGGFQWAFWVTGLTGLAAVPVTFLLIRRTELARAAAASRQREPSVAAAD